MSAHWELLGPGSARGNPLPPRYRIRWTLGAFRQGARIYEASSSGAARAFELDASGASPTFTLLSHVPGATHFSQVGDVHPYDVGHPSGLPVVLMSRYRETIAVLAADGMMDEPEEP